MTTIAIIPEFGDRSHDLPTRYRAICGEQQAVGETPGQALDQIEQQLRDLEIGRESATAIILHRTQGDRFFSREQQEKLQDLMTEFQGSLATGEPLPGNTQQALNNLVEMEWEAAIKHSQNLLQQIQSEPNQSDRMS